jgi:hypothetical protein
VFEVLEVEGEVRELAAGAREKRDQIGGRGGAPERNLEMLEGGDIEKIQIQGCGDVGE